MLYVLTKEEADRSEKETNDFLLSLDCSIKYGLVSLLKPILKQRDCEHDWLDLDSYENQMPKNSLLCQKCNLIKKK